MSEHAEHLAMGLPGPENTLPMMIGSGPYGSIEMGGMFTVLKIRDGLSAHSYADPGWYQHPQGTLARRVSFDPAYAVPDSMNGMQHQDPGMKDVPGMEMDGANHGD